MGAFGVRTTRDNMELDEMPNELLLRVFTYLERFSQLRLRRVSDHWNQLLSLPTVATILKLEAHLLGKAVKRITKSSANSVYETMRTLVKPETKFIIFYGDSQLAEDSFPGSAEVAETENKPSDVLFIPPNVHHHMALTGAVFYNLELDYYNLLVFIWLAWHPVGTQLVLKKVTLRNERLPSEEIFYKHMRFEEGSACDYFPLKIEKATGFFERHLGAKKEVLDDVIRKTVSDNQSATE